MPERKENRGHGHYGHKDVAALLGVKPLTVKTLLTREGISIKDFPKVVEFVVDRRLQDQSRVKEDLILERMKAVQSAQEALNQAFQDEGLSHAVGVFRLRDVWRITISGETLLFSDLELSTSRVPVAEMIRIRIDALREEKKNSRHLLEE